MYKYLSILGYQKALEIILKEYDGKFDEIKILLSTLNYSSHLCDDLRGLCEKLYKKLMIDHFKNVNKLKFTIGEENIFDPNSKEVYTFLTKNSHEYFYSFFHSGDPHSFVGNGGPCDPTLEGCMFGAHHVRNINDPMILLPISVMNMVFFLFKNDIFEKFKHSFIQQVSSPKEKEVKEEFLDSNKKPEIIKAEIENIEQKEQKESNLKNIVLCSVSFISVLLLLVWIYKNRYEINIAISCLMGKIKKVYILKNFFSMC